MPDLRLGGEPLLNELARTALREPAEEELMILLCGIPTETPIALVREALDDNGARYVVLNQRKFSSMKMSLEIKGGKPPAGCN
jgi:hypothetical protein